MTKGRLIQPFATVVWGGENLSFGEKSESVLAQKVSITLTNTSAPSCKFHFLPNPEGFEKFTELKKGSIEAPIVITLGYPNGSFIEQQFQYIGMNLTTGIDPSIEVTGTSLLKGPFTDTRISYTMEEPIPLTELPRFLLGKLNPAPKLKIEFSPDAKKAAAEIEYLENIFQKTPYSILQSVMRTHGFRLDPGDSCYDGTATISLAPDGSGTPPQEGKGQQPIAGETRYHILGPGIATNVKREQKFSIGKSSTKTGQSRNSPSSVEQDQANVNLAPAGAAQPSSAATTTQAGAIGNANPQSTSESRTTPAGSQKKSKRRAQTDNILTTEVSFTVPMLPNFMGVKPRDFILIPSLKGLGEYIEDWEVDSVQYTQDTSGTIMMSIKGNRPFSGDENVVDSGTLDQVRQRISSLTTPELWGQYYWQPKQS